MPIDHLPPDKVKRPKVSKRQHDRKARVLDCSSCSLNSHENAKNTEPHFAPVLAASTLRSKSRRTHSGLVSNSSGGYVPVSSQHKHMGNKCDEPDIPSSHTSSHHYRPFVSRYGGLPSSEDAQHALVTPDYGWHTSKYRVPSSSMGSPTALDMSGHRRYDSRHRVSSTGKYRAGHLGSPLDNSAETWRKKLAKFGERRSSPIHRPAGPPPREYAYYARILRSKNISVHTPPFSSPTTMPDTRVSLGELGARYLLHTFFDSDDRAQQNDLGEYITWVLRKWNHVSSKKGFYGTIIILQRIAYKKPKRAFQAYVDRAHPRLLFLLGFIIACKVLTGVGSTQNFHHALAEGKISLAGLKRAVRWTVGHLRGDLEIPRFMLKVFEDAIKWEFEDSRGPFVITTAWLEPSFTRPLTRSRTAKR